MVSGKKKGSSLEKKRARRNGARVVKGSGCGRIHKGDVSSADVLEECKYRGSKTKAHEHFIDLRHDWFRQAWRQANAAGKTPWVTVSMGEDEKLQTYTYKYIGEEKSKGWVEDIKPGKGHRVFLWELLSQGGTADIVVEGVPGLWRAETTTYGE